MLCPLKFPYQIKKQGKKMKKSERIFTELECKVSSVMIPFVGNSSEMLIHLKSEEKKFSTLFHYTGGKTNFLKTIRSLKNK